MITWTAGTCSQRGCPMTLVMYVGGGSWLCWLHAMLCGIAPAVAGEKESGR